MLKRNLLMTGLLLASALATAQDWQTPVRVAAASGNLERALTIVDERLRDSPADVEAQGWRARLLAWSQRYAEAEAAYRVTLEKAPRDVDLLCGLADVLAWQGKDAEALAVLEQARSLPPPQTAVLNRHARALMRLGRLWEARTEFSQALRLNPDDTEARRGLRALSEVHRHEVRLGVDADAFNYTDTAGAQSLTLISRWRERWTTTFALTTYQRFGAGAQRVTTRVSRRLGARAWVTGGTGLGHDQTIIPRHELFFEYGRTLRASRSGLLRGVELSLAQQSLWFRDARVQTISATPTLYLPRDWSWSLTLVGARSAFAAGAEWRPSGSTRLSFPLRGEQLRGHLLFAVGTEDFAKTDQVGHFAARTFGGGLRYQITPAHDIAGYVTHQDRSQGRSQTSFGFSYGFRF